MKRLSALPILCAVMALYAPHASAAAGHSAVYGFWVSSNFGSVIELGRCGDDGLLLPGTAITDNANADTLCASLRWLWDTGVNGRRLLDGKNPDSALRDQPMLGLSLFSGMRRDGNAWRGRIYNPEDGRRYRASVTALSPTLIRLEGCWGPFCRKQHWRRLGSFTLPTEQSLRGANKRLLPKKPQ